LQIIVCDNASSDDSVKKIRAWAAKIESKYSESGKPLTFTERDLSDGREAAPDATQSRWDTVRLTLIQTGYNMGFARGNNIGVRYALSSGAEYVFVLNNDTRVQADCISKLVEFGEQNHRIALLGPKVLDEGSMQYTTPAVLQRVDFWYMLLAASPLRRLIIHTRLLRRFYYLEDLPGAVYAIPGSAMMFKALPLKEIGLFDEATFLYWEEFIIAEKLRNINLLTFIVPDAVVWHKQRASIKKIGSRIFMENIRSERYFFHQYLQLSYWKTTVVNIVRFASYIARSTADDNYRKNFPEFIRLFLDAK
jgi:GT2 family glycosyltransferase